MKSLNLPIFFPQKPGWPCGWYCSERLSKISYCIVKAKYLMKKMMNPRISEWTEPQLGLFQLLGKKMGLFSGSLAKKLGLWPILGNLPKILWVWPIFITFSQKLGVCLSPEVTLRNWPVPIFSPNFQNIGQTSQNFPKSQLFLLPPQNWPKSQFFQQLEKESSRESLHFHRRTFVATLTSLATLPIPFLLWSNPMTFPI